MPPTDPNMGMDPMMGGGDPNAMGGANPNMGPDPMGGDPNAMGDDPNAMGGDPNANGGESQFDTNFDAGVEADEDEDPKKYLQQLTGKLSTTLGSYLGENEDGELCKYVGKMIIKQVAKGLDEKGKKDLIKTIKNGDEEDIPEDNNDGDTNEMDMEAPEDMGNEENPQMPMNENFYTKKGLKTIFEGVGPVNKSERDDTYFPKGKGVPKKTKFSGKQFNA